MINNKKKYQITNETIPEIKLSNSVLINPIKKQKKTLKIKSEKILKIEK